MPSTARNELRRVPQIYVTFYKVSRSNCRTHQSLAGIIACTRERPAPSGLGLRVRAEYLRCFYRHPEWVTNKNCHFCKAYDQARADVQRVVLAAAKKFRATVWRCSSRRGMFVHVFRYEATPSDVKRAKALRRLVVEQLRRLGYTIEMRTDNGGIELRPATGKWSARKVAA